MTGYTDGAVIAGQIFGDPASGIRPDTSGTFGALDAFILVDAMDLEPLPADGRDDGRRDRH